MGLFDSIRATRDPALDRQLQTKLRRDSHTVNDGTVPPKGGFGHVVIDRRPPVPKSELKTFKGIPRVG